MKSLFVFAIAFVFVSCSEAPEALRVKQYTLRDLKTEEDHEPMIRNEKMHRLYGAVSLEERQAKIGQYYDVLWNAPANSKKEIVFYYQQGSSKIQQMRRSIPSGTANGKEEFSVIGENYLKNGRVLAWKINFLADGKLLASQQSYLWK